jgi:hypothetical protein
VRPSRALAEGRPASIRLAGEPNALRLPQATKNPLRFSPTGRPRVHGRARLAPVPRLEHAEYVTSFAPAGAERFFPEVAPRVVPGEPAPPPSEPDPEEFARIAASYGIEIVGPPPTLD